MASTFASTPLIGVNLGSTNTTPQFGLGTPVLGNLNDTWVYVKATEAVTGTCTVNTTTWALTDTAGNYTAPVSFASGDYGWVYKTSSPL